MEIADHAAALHQLIVRLRAWDEGLEGLDDDGAGLASAERAALLDELRALAGEGSAAADPWQSLRSFFSPRGHSPAEERARREHALLCEYERLCERDLPFGVSSMLVRHHSAIKRAANLAAGRLHLPTPPRGSALAAMAAPPTPPPDAPAAR
jgi:hypothetical protein